MRTCGERRGLSAAIVCRSCRTGRVGWKIPKEAVMTDRNQSTPASLALLALMEIKAATEAFDSGDTNVFDALDAIIAAIEDVRAAAVDRGRREAA